MEFIEMVLVGGALIYLEVKVRGLRERHAEQVVAWRENMQADRASISRLEQEVKKLKESISG
jgi:polyhydroxyalkanoate synthesis regulator phasin